MEKHQQFSKGKLVGEQIGTSGNLHSVDVSKGPIAATTGKVFSEEDQSSAQNTVTAPQGNVGEVAGAAVGPMEAPSPIVQPAVPVAPVGQTPSLAKQGLAAAQASGLPAPSSAGEAKAAMAPFKPPQAPDTTDLEARIGQDPGYQQLLKDRAEFTNLQKQGQSLVKQYQQMTKAAGIPELNAELINAKNIIDGTEDDIRKEVQAAGGFATESQVMALSSSRNKQLIMNYNNLLETKNQAMENVQTMIGLAKDDQQTAFQSLTEKMAFDQQIISYRDKFFDNAKEGYNSVIKAVGYDGLYKSLQADPHSIPIVEKTLGLAAGQLQTLASQPNLDKQIQQQQLTNLKLDTQKKVLDIQNTTTGGDSVQGLGQQLVDGNLAPSELSKRTSNYNAVLKAADDYSMQTTGEHFNIAKSERDYKYASNVNTQNVLKYLGALVGTDGASGNLDELINASNSINRTKFPALNKVQNWSKLETGDPQIAAYHAVVTEVADQIAKILQGGGGSVTSDAKLQQAADLFRSDFTKDQITATVSSIKPLLANRANNLIGDNTYLRDFKSSLNLSSQGGPTKTFTIPLPGGGTLDLGSFETK